MSATDELKPCPFCGDEASWFAARQREDGTYYPAACGCRKCGIWHYGESNYGHGGFATEEDRKESMEQAVSKWNTRTHEQAIAATLGSGKLTAEQVMMIAGKHQPDYCSDTHVCFDWQAIADELNAALGGDVLEWYGGDSWCATDCSQDDFSDNIGASVIVARKAVKR